MEEEKLIKERLEIIPEELRNLLIAPELPRRISLIAKKYRIAENQEKIIRNEIMYLCLGLESLDNFPIQLKRGLSLSDDTTDSLTRDIMDYILRSVAPLLVHTEAELLEQTTPIPEPEPEMELSTEIPPSLPLSREEPEEHPTKHEILNEIERPHRTVIKKYTIEYDHAPLKDTTHLIDDTVDDVIKLEEGYND